MINKLSQKDVRALKIGAVIVAALTVLVLALYGYERWDTAKQRSLALKNQLNDIDGPYSLYLFNII